MRPHVSFQLVGVLAGIAAQLALVGALPRVRPDVALQLARLSSKGKVLVARES